MGNNDIASRVYHCLESTGVPVKSGKYVIEHDGMKHKFLPNDVPWRIEHLYAAEGILQAFEVIRKEYPGIFRAIQKEYSVVPAPYDNDNVSMLTSRGRENFLIMNTNASIKGNPCGIVAAKFVDALPKDTSLADRIRLNFKIVTFHELGHVIDGFSGECLSEALLKTQQHFGGRFMEYLAEKVSGYAASSEEEGMAEIIALTLGKGDVPRPFVKVKDILKQLDQEIQEDDDYKLAA